MNFFLQNQSGPHGVHAVHQLQNTQRGSGSGKPARPSEHSEGRDLTTDPWRVLVIDDDRGMRDSLAMVLENEGLEAMVATNGAEAMECLRQLSRAPDLIILDLMMPVMNGWDFRSAQLADPQLAAIPTVVLTADTDASRQANELAVSHCLYKPIDVDSLLDVVARLIPDWQPDD